MIRWTVPNEKLFRLMEVLAEIVEARFDERDRDAIAFGLRDAPADGCYEYVLHGTTTMRLRLSCPGTGSIAVEAEPDEDTTSAVARIEIRTDEEVVRTIYHAFRNAPRPDWFTRFWHCPECEGHNTLLDSRNWDNLTHHDLRETWSPLGFLNPEGFRFWLPALLRLGLTEDEHGFSDQLFRYLATPEAAETWGLSRGERAAVPAFLQHLAWWHPELVGERRDFKSILQSWRGEYEPV